MICPGGPVVQNHPQNDTVSESVSWLLSVRYESELKGWDDAGTK